MDHVEPFLTAQPFHLRVGWALTEGFSPYPGGGEGWGANGVGDDLFSYAFDGLHLWSGKVGTTRKQTFVDIWPAELTSAQSLNNLLDIYCYVACMFYR